QTPAPATPAGLAPAWVRPAAAPPPVPVPPPHKLPPAAETAPPPQAVVAPAPPHGHDGTRIDLAAALKLAGVENPEILIARQRVVYAVAVRQFAAAQILPTLNAGMNYDAHTGPVQQSNGNILKVNRSALYIGAGANAVAAGTVSI